MFYKFFIIIFVYSLYIDTFTMKRYIVSKETQKVSYFPNNILYVE